MGGSSSQVIGYKYYAGLMVAIGNTIEKLININPDNRGWILKNPINSDGAVFIDKPNLFGGDKQEGGWVGWIDLHTGKPDALRQNPYLALHDSEIVSAFPNMSYLVYRGPDMNTGFQLVSMSGTMKEVLYHVKRIHVKNDGSEQWYDEKAEITSKEWINNGGPSKTAYFQQKSVIETPSGKYEQESSGTWTVANDLSMQPVVASGDVGVGGSASVSQSIKMDGKGVASVRFILTHLRDAVPSLAINGISNVTTETYQDDPSNILVSYLITGDFVIGVGFSLYAKASANADYDVTIAFENMVLFNAREKFEQVIINNGDMNPIHKIREILTDDTAMNKPESDVSDINFIAAASRIFDEGLGISWAIQEKSCKDAIDELLYHIEAGIRVNRQTGLYEIILFRDDLLYLDDAMSFNESNIKTFSHEIAKQDDLTNSLNVKYYDRATIKESSFSVYDNGSIFSNGNQEITESIDFPYFMTRRNSEKVANWKLKQLSTPTWKGSFTTGKYEARKLNKYDVIKLSWMNANLVELPVRVMKISIGDGVDNTVTIDWVEVIPYSSLDFQPIFSDSPTSTVLPPKPNKSVVFEMPYFEAVQNFGQTQVNIELSENPEIGYLYASSLSPQNNSINALLYTSLDGIDYYQRDTINYCPSFTLDQDIGLINTSFAVKNAKSVSEMKTGTCIIIDEEIMVFLSYDRNTKIINVKRGALDTVPVEHKTNAILFFYDMYPSFDRNQYGSGEIVRAKSLTTTPSGILNAVDAAELQLEIKSRAIRPYPPANVTIDNVYYKNEIAFDQTSLLLKWSHRNRLQQTGGSIFGWFDGSVTPEPNLSYDVSIYSINNSNIEALVYHTVLTENHLSVDITAFPPMLYRIEIKSIVGSYYSFQKFTHTLRKNDNTVNFIINQSEVYVPKLNNSVDFILGD